MREDDPKKPKSPQKSTGESVPGLKAGTRPALSPSVQAEIGHRLRHFYDSLALGESPVPDRFIEIINQLDEHDMGRERREQHS
jgi:hypothetical protein